MHVGALLGLVFRRGEAVTRTAVQFVLEIGLGGAEILDQDVDLRERSGREYRPDVARAPA